ncbi:hypothetical protein ACIA8K_29455 [Catenuloplanes sp. NPDC051500]|uniref:hypothetical protein n=1 Tax=Catenuloplanes sp. NPDC051500 TaxID=3363959 RepID=UPI0037A67986
MAGAGDTFLICADGRFIAVPGGVFYHDGAMSDPVDHAALTGAMQSPRVNGSIMVYVQDTIGIGALDRVRRALEEIPAAIRDRLMLGTLPGERVNPAVWMDLADAFGLPKHALFAPGLTPSARVVPLGVTGLETRTDPATVRVLPRAQAAARETLRTVLDGGEPSWNRLEELIAGAAAIRDELRIPLRLRVDGQRGQSGAAYALAAGIALYGPPPGTDPAALLRGVRPIGTDDVLRAWGGPAVATEPGALVAALVAAPGSGALVRLDVAGGGRPGLGWLVSRPDGLVWIDLELDGDASIRVMTAPDAVSLLGALPGGRPAVLRVDATGRPATGLPVPARATDVGARGVTPAGAPERAALGEGQILELFGRVVESGERAAAAHGDRTLAECLALIQDLVGRLHHDGVRVPRTREEPGAGRAAESWLGDRQDWQRFGGWDALTDRLTNEPELGPGSLAVVLTERTNATAGHVYAAYHTSDQGVLWINLTSAGTAPRVGTPGGLPAESAAYTRAIVIDPSGTVSSDTRAPEPEWRSTARSVIDAPITIGYRGGGIEAERTMPLELPALKEGEVDDITLAHTADRSIDLLLEEKWLYQRDGTYHLTATSSDEESERTAVVEVRAGVLGILPGEENRIQDSDEFWDRLIALEERFERVDTEPGTPDTRLRLLLSGLGFGFTPLAVGAKIGAPPEGDAGGNHGHMSFGVAPAILKPVLKTVTDGTWRDDSITHESIVGPVPYRTKAGQAEGTTFGAETAGRLDEFFTSHGLAGTAYVSEAVEGILTLVYSHTSGYLDSWVPSDTVKKAHIATLSRQDHRLYWADLPWWQAFGLALHATEVRDGIGRSYLRNNQAFLDRMRQVGKLRPERAGITAENWSGYRTGAAPTADEYVRASITGRTLDPRDVFGPITLFPELDTNEGRLRHGLAILEVRSFGARRVTMRELRDRFRTIADVIRTEYARIADQPPLRTVRLQVTDPGVNTPTAAMFRAVALAQDGDLDGAARQTAVANAGLGDAEREQWTSMLTRRAPMEQDEAFGGQMRKIAYEIAPPDARAWFDAVTDDRWATGDDSGSARGTTSPWYDIGLALIEEQQYEAAGALFRTLETSVRVSAAAEHALALIRANTMTARLEALRDLLSMAGPDGFGAARAVLQAVDVPADQRRMVEALGAMLSDDLDSAFEIVDSLFARLSQEFQGSWAGVAYDLAGSGPLPDRLVELAVEAWQSVTDPMSAYFAQLRLTSFVEAGGPGIRRLVDDRVSALLGKTRTPIGVRRKAVAWALGDLGIAPEIYHLLNAENAAGRQRILQHTIDRSPESDSESESITPRQSADPGPVIEARTVTHFQTLLALVDDAEPLDIVLRDTLGAVAAVASGDESGVRSTLRDLLAENQNHVEHVVWLLEALRSRNLAPSVRDAVETVDLVVADSSTSSAVPAPGGGLLKTARTALGEGQIRELFGQVVESGERAAAAHGDRTLAECLALIQDLVGRLHHDGVRVPRTREEPGAGRAAESWLGDRQDWQRFGGWDALTDRLTNEPELGPGSLAVVLTERTNATAGHVYAAYHTSDQGVLWINLTSAGTAPRVGTPGGLPAESAAYTRAIVIDPSGTVSSDTRAPEPEWRSTARSVIDAPITIGYRGGGIEAERTMPLELPAVEGEAHGGTRLARTADQSIDLIIDEKSLFKRDGAYYLTAESLSEKAVSTPITEVRTGVLGILPGEENRIQDTDEFWNRLIALENRFEWILTDPGTPEAHLGDLLSGLGYRFWKAARGAMIGAPPEGDEGGNHGHMSFGVAPAILKPVLKAVTDGTWRDGSVTYPTVLGPLPYRTKAAQAEGATFGAETAGRLDEFFTSHGLAGQTYVSEAVEGILTLVYSHTSGYLDSWVPSPNIMKAHIATLSRHDHRVFWIDLPWWEAFALALHATEIQDGIGRSYLGNNTSHLNRMHDVVTEQPAMAGMTAENWSGYRLDNAPTAGEYVRASVTGRGMDPTDVFGGMTRFPELDTNEGRLRHGLAILEVRSFGARRVTMRQLRNYFRQLADVIRTEYARIVDQPPLRTVRLQVTDPGVNTPTAAMFRAVALAQDGDLDGAARQTTAANAGLSDTERARWVSMLTRRAPMEQDEAFGDAMRHIAFAIAPPDVRAWFDAVTDDRWANDDDAIDDLVGKPTWSDVGLELIEEQQYGAAGALFTALESAVVVTAAAVPAVQLIRANTVPARISALWELLSVAGPDGFGAAQAVLQAVDVPADQRRMVEALGAMLDDDLARALEIVDSLFAGLSPDSRGRWAKAAHDLTGSGPLPDRLVELAVQAFQSAPTPLLTYDEQGRMRSFAQAGGPAIQQLLDARISALRENDQVPLAARRRAVAWGLSNLDIGADAYHFLEAKNADDRRKLLIKMIDRWADSGSESDSDTIRPARTAATGESPVFDVQVVALFRMLLAVVSHAEPLDIALQGTLQAVVQVATGHPTGVRSALRGLLDQHRSHVEHMVWLLEALRSRNLTPGVRDAVEQVDAIVASTSDNPAAPAVWTAHQPGPSSQWDHHQTYLARVEFQNPPGIPSALRGLETGHRLDRLRKHARAAEPRVSTTLARFPNSDEAARWRAAIAGLKTATAESGQVRDLVAAFDHAASGLLRLDPGAVGDLTPLWTGRLTAARETPALRTIGTWPFGDLSALTAGLDRPVLTVNLGGRASHTLDELESTLREHRLWGETPIVFATLGTTVTEARFTALHRRFRPIVVQQAMTDDIEMVWRLFQQDGRPATQTGLIGADLLREAVALPVVTSGRFVPPVLAGLLTAGDGAQRFHRENAQKLTDPGVRDALRALADTEPDGARLAGLQVALGMPAAPADHPVPSATSVLDVEPPWTGGPVPATFAHDFLAQNGGRAERYRMDGLLFAIVTAGRMSQADALTLLRATAATKADLAVTQVFESVFDVLNLSGERAAADPHTDPELLRILGRVSTVSSTARPAGTPLPDCVDPNDRTAFVGRLDALRDRLRAEGRSAHADLIETVNYILANC